MEEPFWPELPVAWRVALRPAEKPVFEVVTVTVPSCAAQAGEANRIGAAATLTASPTRISLSMTVPPLLVLWRSSAIDRTPFCAWYRSTQNSRFHHFAHEA